MEYFAKPVEPIIKMRMNYGKFTTVERIVADFFIQNRERVDLSSKAMADRLYVSEASLSRFAQKCGYRGYREFVYQYETAFSEGLASVTSDTRMLLKAYQEVLNSAYRMVDEAQIVRIGQYIKKAQRVLVCGQGNAGGTAVEMEERFTRAGVDITAVQDSRRMRLLAALQNRRSLVFGISAGGNIEAELYLLRESHKRGAKTVLISVEAGEDFRQFCTEVLLIPSLQYLYRDNAISPQIPILLMLDILYAHYSGQGLED